MDENKAIFSQVEFKKNIKEGDVVYRFNEKKIEMEKFLVATCHDGVALFVDKSKSKPELSAVTWEYGKTIEEASFIWEKEIRKSLARIEREAKKTNRLKELVGLCEKFREEKVK